MDEEKETSSSKETNAEENEIQKLQKEIEELKSELEKNKQEILYVKADFENAKKRIQKDQFSAIQRANEKFLKELLLIVNYFDQALLHTETAKTQSEMLPFISGVEMTHKELCQMLNRFGVELIGKVGEVFDPQIHEAITQKESKNPPGTILEVFSRGGLLHGKILEPAKVVVTKAKENEQT